MHRRHRLRRAADFELLRQEGKRWHHPLLLMVTRANNQKFSRFGFSAGKRLGKATIRNRVKRLLREIVRRNMSAIDAGWDCLFIALDGAAGVTCSELEAAVVELLQRSNLLKPSSSKE